ncbi:hypothetical protein OG713_26975 [Streptomyces sp. NBC_00723]|uniref:LPO_1073/Vpar_1526 family protein n=1 Tax=Streptomyces sp. NBC_00723 TaxID=2903673 RepID=UPI0038694122
MKQIQRAGDNTANYQAQTINVNGVNYTEAKEIALDVFRANAIELSQIARRVAEDRVEEITEALLRKLAEKAPEALNAITDPGVQRAIFRVQEEYACSGDEALGDVLVDLLVDRAQNNERNIQQVTLNEAIKTAPKLAPHHFTILATLLIVVRTQYAKAQNIAELHDYFKSTMAPTVAGVRASESDLRHLQYAGCISYDESQRSISGMLSGSYPAFFTKGFSIDEVNDPCKELKPPALMPCVRDNSRLQVGAVNKEVLQKRLIPELKLEECTAELTRLMDVGLMPGNEIEDEFAELHPNLRDLVSLWGSSQISHCQPTSVGIAIGHAEVRRILGSEFNFGIEIWVS